jgi:ankyrin repeat protein
VFGMEASNDFQSYLVQAGIINLSIQHANMALFCTEYLLSAPFRLMIPDDEIQRYAKSGYYVLQNYAVLYWFDHLMSSVKKTLPVPVNELNVYDQLLHCTNSFLKAYGIQSKLKDIIKNEAIKSLTGICCCLPRDLKTRTELFDLEWRTLRIRNVIERLLDKGESNGINQNVFQELYGMNHFKCPRIWCYAFTGGFNGLLARDKHVKRHDRPFNCIDMGCPYYKLGFETEVKLNRHVRRNHPWANDNGFQFPQPPKHKEDTIYKAAGRGDETVVEYFLEAGVNIHESTNAGVTPLLLAAENGHIGVCKLLLNKGADVNFKRPRRSTGMTALHAAVKAGEEEVVRYLLTVRDIRLDEEAKGGVNLLHFAAEAGHLQIFDMLLKTGKVNIEARGRTPWPPRSWQTPIMWAVEMGHGAIVRMLLMEPHVKANARDDKGNTILHMAAAHGDEAMLKMILSTGIIELNSKNTSSQTPLHVAAQQEHRLIVNTLLAADPNLKNIFGKTRLSVAVRKGDESIVNALLSTEKIDPNLKDESGETPLLIAIQEEHLMITKLLVERGADLEASDRDGYTPLMWAAKHGYGAIVRLLVEKGANIESEGNDHSRFLGASARCKEISRDNIEMG